MFLSFSARPDQFSRDLIREHNTLRASTMRLHSHGHQMLRVWLSVGLIILPAQCQLEHGPNDELKQRNLGQNLAFVSGGNVTANRISDMWYDELKDYDFGKPGYASNTGHFTQLVWRDTKQIGIGRASKGHSVFVAGNYSPAGNVQGRFEENVKPTN